MIIIKILGRSSKIFGFKRNKVDEKLLEEKYLNKAKFDFEKWLQNTYEALSFEQLECVSRYAKEVYNIDDEEFADITSNRFVRYFPTTKEFLPPTSRGKRREMKVCDDACLMDKKEMDSILNNSHFGLSKEEILLKLGDSELLNYYNENNVDFRILCFGINIGLSIEEMTKVFNDIKNSGDDSFSFAMRCLEHYYMVKHVGYNESKEWYEPEVTKLHFKKIQASNSNYKTYVEFIAPVSNNFNKNFSSDEYDLLVQIYTQGNFPYRKAGTLVAVTKTNQ